MQEVIQIFDVNSTREVEEGIRPLMQVEFTDKVFRKELLTFTWNDERFTIKEISRAPFDLPLTTSP